MKIPNISAWKTDLNAAPLNLEALELPPEAATFDQLCAGLPEGAYTTLRTYDGSKALHPEAHLKRLRETARLAGAPVRLDTLAARRALRSVISAYPNGVDLRLRLVLDLEERPGELYICVMPLMKLPERTYRRGVWVVISDLRRQLPRAKLTRFIARADRERRALPAGAHEALMVDQRRRILEGLSSNFFAVRAGELWTAEEAVLAGTTRAWVLDLAGELRIPVRLEALPVDDLSEVEEAFITSSSRAVVPVRKVGDVVIGAGQPGLITRRLMAAYEARLAGELEEI